jgi:flagellar hook protein FlgE
MIDAMGAAVSGLQRAGMWMAATASNIANADTPGYQAQDALNPSANNGTASTLSYTVDLAVEIPNLLMATSSFKANLVVMAAAREAYQSVIDLGR